MQSELSRLNCIEAILFTSEDPLSLKKLTELLECDGGEVEVALEQLAQRYQDTSLQVQFVAQGYSIVTKATYAHLVERAHKTRSQKLSRASLETLAIVAYRQPITRVEIDEIRGVKSEKVLATLLNRNLILEVGRQDTVGRPILYGTTEAFLRHFGLNSVDDLPRPDDLKL